MKSGGRGWPARHEGAAMHAGPDPSCPVATAREGDWRYANFAQHVRTTDPDPEKLGIREMYRIFDLYERKRQSRIGSGTGC